MPQKLFQKLRAVVAAVSIALAAGAIFILPSKFLHVVSAQSISLSRQSTTILSGASISSTIPTADQVVIAVEIPSAWTTANLTFQVSWNGTDWTNVYNMFGEEFTVIVGGSTRSIVMAPSEFQWARYLRIRSGTSGTPVNQGADRTVYITTRNVR